LLYQQKEGHQEQEDIRREEIVNDKTENRVKTERTTTKGKFTGKSTSSTLKVSI
jgi:hypothetical protein